MIAHDKAENKPRGTYCALQRTADLRVDPVMPRRPVVPAGAPAELRLDAKKSDIIPEYPY
jgi:hypothetical protein